ncbi:hypothetical protein PSPO01_09948 [Paraphaeosphaeria sporulosa]
MRIQCRCKRRNNHDKQTWAKALSRKADAHLSHTQYRKEMERFFGRIDVRYDDAWVEDIAHRELEGGNWSEGCMQQGAMWEVVQSWEPWVEIGEIFGAWARRTREMRAVKEGRLRVACEAQSTASATEEEESQRAGSVEVEKAKEVTTLPTTPSSIEAHALLDLALRPPWRGKANQVPPTCHNYDFFGEYEWYWRMP